MERCGEHGGFVHWGATTQDIVDTALVMAARTALGPIRQDSSERRVARPVLPDAMRARPWPAGRTASTRSRSRSGSRLRLGRRARARSRPARPGRRDHLDGAALGRRRHVRDLGGDAAAVQEAFCRRLGLARADVHWHPTRDRLRDLGQALAELASAAERIAAEVVRLQATEVEEAAEPSTDAHVGSSTMPQKRNPMTCEYVIASARLLRAQTGALADAGAHAFERDMGLWAVEWIALPQALILAGGIADKLAGVLEGLVVDEERMRANLDLTGGQIMAEAVTMALAGAIGHEPAHAAVLAASRRALAAGRPLLDELADDAAVSAHVNRAELERIMDPGSYLGLSADSAESVARRVLGEP